MIKSKLSRFIAHRVVHCCVQILHSVHDIHSSRSRSADAVEFVHQRKRCTFRDWSSTHLLMDILELRTATIIDRIALVIS